MNFLHYAVFAGAIFLLGCHHREPENSANGPPFTCRERLRNCEETRIDVVESVGEFDASNDQVWAVGILQSYGPEHTSTSEINRVILFFHGGPGVPFVSPRLLGRLTEVFGSEGTLIASVAYSGTELPNFHGSRRLRQHHLDAIEQDVHLVAQYVRSLQRTNPIRDVVVVGGSFGAIPALRLASELGDDLDGLILNSPWLFPLSVNDYVDSPVSYLSGGAILASPADRESLRPGLLEQYRDYLGLSAEMDGSSSGEQYLERARSEGCRVIERKALVFIAQHEDRANVQLTREYFERCAGPGSVVDVQNSFHGMEYSFSWVRQAMREFSGRQ